MRITNSYMNRVHGIRLDKRAQEFVNIARKAAHEAQAQRDFKVYQQGVLDGTRTPRIREDSPTAVVMKHAIRAMRKHNASRVRSTGPMSKQTSRGLDSI